jgi:rhodanese-related sulfurtransferase
MRIVVRFTQEQELKALPILLRHSPGTVLPDRTYVISEKAARQLRLAGIDFVEVTRESTAPKLEGVGPGERV